MSKAKPKLLALLICGAVVLAPLTITSVEPQSEIGAWIGGEAGGDNGAIVGAVAGGLLGFLGGAWVGSAFGPAGATWLGLDAAGWASGAGAIIGGG